MSQRSVSSIAYPYPVPYSVPKNDLKERMAVLAEKRKPGCSHKHKSTTVPAECCVSGSNICTLYVYSNHHGARTGRPECRKCSVVVDVSLIHVAYCFTAVDVLDSF